MKAMNIYMKLFAIMLLVSVVMPAASFATDSTDTEIQCRPIKMDEPYRSFGFRLRETPAGMKMVKRSVYSHPRFERFDTLMVRPQIKTTETELEILAGKEPNWTAFRMVKAPNTTVWNGRIQIWWPGQTATFTSRVLCFTSQEYSNGEPVIK